MRGVDARNRRVKCCPECAMWQEEVVTCLIPLSESFSASLCRVLFEKQVGIVGFLQ